jgi:hypothetical protein
MQLSHIAADAWRSNRRRKNTNILDEYVLGMIKRHREKLGYYPEVIDVPLRIYRRLSHKSYMFPRPLRIMDYIPIVSDADVPNPPSFNDMIARVDVVCSDLQMLGDKPTYDYYRYAMSRHKLTDIVAIRRYRPFDGCITIDVETRFRWLDNFGFSLMFSYAMLERLRLNNFRHYILTDIPEHETQEMTRAQLEDYIETLRSFGIRLFAQRESLM